MLSRSTNAGDLASIVAHLIACFQLVGNLIISYDNYCSMMTACIIRGCGQGVNQFIISKIVISEKV